MTMPVKLKTVDNIFVRTALGEREIQLCAGDITYLHADEAVDFILVSAFLGDYSAMRGTVIGALKQNLDISVRNLALDKQEDLRHQFNCWISKELSPGLPYRQLLCFERMAAGDLAEAVKEIFRAMMPAFNNTKKTVITPLLATGHQRADEGTILKAMVHTAAKWMWLGMPLQKLKIVIYSHDVETFSSANENMLASFRKMKEMIERFNHIPREPVIILDIFIIFCEADIEYLDALMKYLKKQKKNISTLTIKDVTLKENRWQHDLSEVFRTVARVIPVLSSKFLCDGSCIDQFNVALCCNRLTKRRLLAPVLLEQMSLPIYMNMVQWINCRSNTDYQYEEAAITIVNHIKTGSEQVQTKYDIFISYSHKNLAVAKTLLEGLEKLDPKPSIFFDYQQLTSGIAWQETLYNSIDKSRCVLALISPEYLASAVCQEEINLALAKHFNKDKDLELVPIYITDTEDENLNRFLNPTRLERDISLSDVCAALGDWLSTGNPPDIFSPVHDSLDPNHDLSLIREDLFRNFYRDAGDEISIISRTETVVEKHQQSQCDVYISHSVRDQKYATFLCEYIQAKGLNVFSKSDTSKSEESLIDSASCIILLLSQSYVNSPTEVEQFNMILCRKRQSKNDNLLYVIKTSNWSMEQTYFDLVPCDTSLCDEFWWQYGLDHRNIWNKHARINTDIKKKLGHSLLQGELCPLLKAACDVLAVCNTGRYLDGIKHNNIILHNIIDVHLQAESIKHDKKTSRGDQLEKMSHKDQLEKTSHGDQLEKTSHGDQLEKTSHEDADLNKILGLPEPPSLLPTHTDISMATTTANHKQVTEDHKQDTEDHKQVTADHTQVTADHTQDTEDHTQVTADHKQDTEDHTQVTADHKQVTADHKQVTEDHEQVTADHKQVTEDHEQVTADHKQVTADHKQVTEDHKQVTADHGQIDKSPRLRARSCIIL